MLNNTVLDIAIGLTFIFVLYSLLAMTVNEFVATIFAYRHRMLERGLEQMLDGKNFSYYWWDKLINFFYWINYRLRELKSKDQNQEIKSLKVFLSKTDLGNPLIEKSDGTSRFYYTRIKINEKAALFTANITAHPLYKRKAEKTLMFKKPAYLSSDSFSDILIDVLGQNRIAGAPILMKDIEAFVNSQIKNNPDLQKVLSLYIEQANGDLQRFKLLVEKWFDDTMDRVSGWYKKQSNRIAIIIGLVLAITFNVSTIELVKKLSKDKDAREALVNNASEYVKTHIADATEKKVTPPAKVVTTVAKKDSAGLAADSIAQSQDSTTTNEVDFSEAKRKLKEMDSLYKNVIAKNDSLLGMGWGDYGVTDRINKYKSDSIDFVQGKLKVMPVRPDDHRNVAGKVMFVLGRTLDSPLLLLGFIITALAISLGAPFWFDLLNKFINLRVSGTKPDETKNRPVASKTAGLNQPNPKSFG